MSGLRSRLLTMVAAGLLSTFASADSAPDLSGIWQIDGVVTQLKAIDGKSPPLSAAAAKLYAARTAQYKRGDKSFDPSSTLCKPPGSPRILYEPFPFEIVQTKDQVIFTYMWNRLYRIVDLGQDNKVIAPTYFGTSNATWRGDTLEVDVKGLHDDTLLDASGMPHSDQLHLIERYQLQDAGEKLNVSIHIEDPKTFTKPWDARISLKRLSGDRLGEDVCEERLGLVK